MNTLLTENRHISQDYAANDDFDFLPKAEAIKTFLEFNVEGLLSNKMLALYGNWGSGKTSLMDCIAKSIRKDLYYPVFFETWQFEKDENLPMSLCDLLSSELLDSHASLIKSFRETASRVMRGFASGVNVKLGGTYLGAEVEINGKDALEGMAPLELHKSAFAINEDFKKLFRKVEEALLEKSKAQRILIFVDDLDRCEPEHVLSLITALKLFFTYGNKTIFFCGLDKEAVTKAVVNKYQDIVKSDEYLEKVFDLSFQMPKSFSLKKMLKRYFGGELVYNDEVHSNVDLIDHFFTAIDFTNPRHIKKVINKYQILRSFKADAAVPPWLKSVLPNLLDKDGRGDVFETIFCLFFIILYEFHLEQFKEIQDYERKLAVYAQIIWDTISQEVTPSRHNISSYLMTVRISNFEEDTMDEIRNDNDGMISFKLTRLLYLLTPARPGRLSMLNDDRLIEFGDFFQDNSKLTLFCKFLILYKAEISRHHFDNYVFWNYFRMCTTLL